MQGYIYPAIFYKDNVMVFIEFTFLTSNLPQKARSWKRLFFGQKDF